jgi:transposase-like protein
MKRKNRTFSKSQNHNLQLQFKSDFKAGKFSICELARRYDVDRRKLLKWKHKYFGKGSIKQKRMFQMSMAGIPTKVIAEFFNVPITQVHLSIRNSKKQPLTLF